MILPIALGTAFVAVAAQETDSPVAETAPAAGTEAPAPRADLSEANALVREEKYEEAEATLAPLQDEFPDDPRLLLMRGEILLALSRAEDALPLLEHCSELDPERARVHFNLATARATTGDIEGALDAYAKELEVNEDTEIAVLVRLNRSMLLQRGKRWDEAIEELQAVLVSQPERVEVFGDIASLQIQAGKTSMAVETLSAGLEAGFRSAQHHYSLGARLFKEKEYEPAVEAFTHALAIDPELANAERSLAASLEKLGRDEEATTHLERYLELAPTARDAEAIREQLKSAENR